MSDERMGQPYLERARKMMSSWFDKDGFWLTKEGSDGNEAALRQIANLAQASASEARDKEAKNNKHVDSMVNGVPIGNFNGGWNHYFTDDEEVLHLYGEGISYDIRFPR